MNAETRVEAILLAEQYGLLWTLEFVAAQIQKEWYEPMSTETFIQVNQDYLPEDPFEGKALFEHQSALFGDIAFRIPKISAMTFEQRDRFTLFRDVNSIIQIRHEEFVPEMNDPQTWVDALSFAMCTLPQAMRIVECLIVIEPERSAVKREYMARTIAALKKADNPFVELERRIKYLAELAMELDALEPSSEDAMNHSEPYIDGQVAETIDGTFVMVDDLSTEEIEELDLVNEAFKDDPISPLSTFISRTVRDEGDGRHFLYQKEFDRLVKKMESCTDLKELSNIATWLYKTKALSREQADIIWPARVPGLPDKSLYRNKRDALEAASQQTVSDPLAQVRFDLARAGGNMRSIRYIGAWIYAQFAGKPFNGKAADPRFAKLDKIQRKKIWNSYRHAVTGSEY